MCWFATWNYNSGWMYDACEWRNALRKFQGSKIQAIDMKDELMQALKFSYNQLSDLGLQQCFLYCALFLEDYKIRREDLIEYLIAEEIIIEESRQAEFDEGHSILNRLEKVCLLEGGIKYGCRYVKMHDLVRDMAIQIMQMNPRTMVQAGKQLRHMPDKEKWIEDLVRYSLMGNNIEEIPYSYSPRCPNRSTMLLCVNEGLRSISASFFVQLGGLKVFDLSYTKIKELPDSISDLVNLSALLILWCENLRNLPSLAKLKSLKKLDLICCGLDEVPQGVELLSELSYLNLEVTNIKELPPRILPKLSNLRYLNLGFDFSPMDSAEDLEELVKLETLMCCFYDVDGFNACTSICSSNLSQFVVPVEEKTYNYGDMGGLLDQERNVIYFSNCIINDVLVLPIKVEKLKILCCNMETSGLCYLQFSAKNNLERFYSENVICYSLKQIELSDCGSVKQLFSPDCLSNLQNLEEISVYSCGNMEELIAMKGDEQEGHRNVQFTLPKLQSLKLSGLPKLKSICSGRMICNSLKQITVIGRPKLKQMPFSLILLDNGGLPFPIPSLQRINVWPREWWELVEFDHAKDVLLPLCEFNLARWKDYKSAAR